MKKINYFYDSFIDEVSRQESESFISKQLKIQDEMRATDDNGIS